jgi:hypothetical protein
LVDDMAADTAGGTSNEDSHGITPSGVGKHTRYVIDPIFIEFRAVGRLPQRGLLSLLLKARTRLARALAGPRPVGKSA